MKLAKYRSQFHVAYFDGTKNFDQHAMKVLREAGYIVTPQSDQNQFLVDVATQPPHMVIVHFRDNDFSYYRFFEQIHDFLPETQIILLTAQRTAQEAYLFLQGEVFDVVISPVDPGYRLVKSLDRAAEIHLHVNRAEQLRGRIRSMSEAGRAEPPRTESVIEEPALSEEFSENTKTDILAEAAKPHMGENSIEGFQPGPDLKPAVETVEPEIDTKQLFSRLEVWQRQLASMRRPDECLDFLMQDLAFESSNPVLFLKWQENNRSLKVIHSMNTTHTINGHGIKLPREYSCHEWWLSNEAPDQMQRFLQVVFGEIEFSKSWFHWGKRLLGVVVYDKSCRSLADFELKSLMIEQQLTNLNLESRLHHAEVRDEVTGLVRQEEFLDRIRLEMTRARRLELPVSFIELKIDNFDVLRQRLTFFEQDELIRSFARILSNHSRSTDLVGRFREDEFGLILPHTDKQGAVIKAERLRRLIGGAKFSDKFRHIENITISLGVSEYPSLCQDAEELIGSADEALRTITKSGSNQVCLAASPQNFQPDF